MKAVIYPNLQKINALSCARSLCDVLHENDFEVIADPQHQALFYDKHFVRYLPFEQAVSETDFAFAIGGDGTILRCAKMLIGTETKLLGINTGHLGFMASMEPSQLHEIARLRTGDYRVSRRMMLCGELTDEKCYVFQHFTALNDIVLARQFARVIDFSVYRNEVLLGQYRADGAIFSTPTGSTAYALSAGGSVIEPEFSCIGFTLVCPHSLATRPILFSPESRLCMRLLRPDTHEVYISSDGETPVPFDPHQQLTIYRSEHTIQLVDLSGNTFFDSLNRKITHSLKGNNGSEYSGGF
ncbi:MAG: NAD(+)/NADH kinase [Ruminococcus sp.]|nr:NAD(+)/NADH kinase [Ruminococcus sp.]